MSYIEHAKREFNALGYKPIDQLNDDDPNKWIQENVFELLEAFSKQGHSGSSAPFCINMFKKLASFEPLAPLTFKDDEWNEVGEDTFQNKRLSAVFKEGKNGKPYYIDAIVWEPQNGGRFTGGAVQVTGGGRIGTAHYIDTTKPFEPKTFNIKVREVEVAPDDWEFYIEDSTKLTEAFEYYERKDK